MRRDALITVVAVISLGVALALNVLLFTLANAILLRPLRLASPSELVVLTLQRPTNLMYDFSHPDYVTLRNAARTPAALIAYSPTEATLAGSAGASVMQGEIVSDDFFSALGVRLRQGRGLGPEDDRPAATPAIVVSEAFWRNRLGSAAVPGAVVGLNGQPFTVVGVAASPFTGMELGRAVDFWVPVAHSGILTGITDVSRPNMSWLTVMARLPKAESGEVMRQELDSIVRAAFEARGRTYEPVVLLPGARGASALPARLEGRFRVLSIAGALVWQVRRASGGGLNEARAVAGTGRRVQKTLLVVQFALSMALLTGAALLVRTIGNLRSTDLGFETARIAVLEVSPNGARLDGPASVSYFEDAVRTMESIPGVEAAAVAHVMPLDFGGSRMSVDIAGYTPRPEEEMEHNFVRITPGYFRTMNIPVLQGRAFDDRDRGPSLRHIVVNETMARRYWPEGAAVGRLVRFNPRQPFNVEVVGVVADAHYRMVREDSRPSFYVPLTEMPARTGVVHARLRDDPSSRLDELRRTLAKVNAAVPLMRTSTLREQLERNIADERLAGAIGLMLATATLLLAAAGLYATMAFLVRRRTREIGVRVALGARAANVQRMVLGDAATLVGIGLLAGLGLAFWVGHTLRSLLYGVTRVDPISVAAAAAVLAAAALVASLVPARRAARVDPIVALRE